MTSDRTPVAGLKPATGGSLLLWSPPFSDGIKHLYGKLDVDVEQQQRLTSDSILSAAAAAAAADTIAYSRDDEDITTNNRYNFQHEKRATRIAFKCRTELARLQSAAVRAVLAC
ncbi:hypothetical protein PoB_005969300 [Plakobranchus ocellatus]|uniref:Uncharacterized protein n=1 Tax=Plakobranchus ocellatus TaxID=259542 RepID=A0AAV4CLZ1_9GAST|nr:hypothetical protein PoB_005969300 [Plakobranchus ocellatus]